MCYTPLLTLLNPSDGSLPRTLSLLFLMDCWHFSLSEAFWMISVGEAFPSSWDVSKDTAFPLQERLENSEHRVTSRISIHISQNQTLVAFTQVILSCLQYCSCSTFCSLSPGIHRQPGWAMGFMASRGPGTRLAGGRSETALKTTPAANCPSEHQATSLHSPFHTMILCSCFPFRSPRLYLCSGQPTLSATMQEQSKEGSSQSELY